MNKQQILARRQVLEEVKSDLITQAQTLDAQINSAIGGINECNFWLAELDKQESQAV